MKIDLAHSKNPAIGWDVQVAVTADAGETITNARIEVNGLPKVDEKFPAPLSRWQRTLQQQGQYPGENKVLVIVTNNKGENINGKDEWE